MCIILKVHYFRMLLAITKLVFFYDFVHRTEKYSGNEETIRESVFGNQAYLTYIIDHYKPLLRTTAWLLTSLVLCASILFVSSLTV